MHHIKFCIWGCFGLLLCAESRAASAQTEVTLRPGAQISAMDRARQKIVLKVRIAGAQKLIVTDSTNGDLRAAMRASIDTARRMACVLPITNGKATLDDDAAAAADSASGRSHCRELLEFPISSKTIHVWVDQPTPAQEMELKLENSVSLGELVIETSTDTEPLIRTRPALLPQGAKEGGKWFVTGDAVQKSDDLPAANPDGSVPFPLEAWDAVLPQLSVKGASVNVYVEMTDGRLGSVNLVPAKTSTAGETPKKKTKIEILCASAFNEMPPVGEWEHVVCVDLRDPRDPVYRFYQRSYDEGHEIDAVHFLAGRKINVVAWYCKDLDDVNIELNGTPQSGVTTMYHGELLASKDKKDACQDSRTSRSFAGRAEGYVNLTLTAKKGDKSVSRVREIRVEAVYSGALRFGASIGWAPFDREYELVSGVTANPGKVIAIKTGDDTYGIPTLELTLGYTFFFNNIYGDRQNGTPGWYVGVGVIKATSDKISAITSIHTGFEYSFGTKFSIGITASLHRAKWLRDNYDVGSTVPASFTDPPTRFGITPAVGILLNFLPDFWKALATASS